MVETVFTIPTSKDGSNHTPQFTESARAIEAHAAVITTSKCLAATALRVLIDDEFFRKVCIFDLAITADVNVINLVQIRASFDAPSQHL